LTDAASGYVVWAQSFNGGLREAALSQGPLMREIVVAVHSAVIAREVERARGQPLPSLEGHTLLLASIGLMHWLSAGDLERARAMLEHLAERAPGHPAPHAWLAHLHVLNLRQGAGAAAAMHEQLARERGAAAVRCDAGSPLALAMLGQACLFAAGDRDAAEERYAQALTARADDSLALVLRAELRALQGRGEAVADARRALAGFPLEPMRCLYDSIHALASLVAGQLEDAISFAQRSTQRNPQFLPAWRTLVVAQVRAGQAAQAQRTVQRWATREPHLSVAQAMAAWPAGGDVAQLLADGLRRAGVPAQREPTSGPGASSSG